MRAARIEVDVGEGGWPVPWDAIRAGRAEEGAEEHPLDPMLLAFATEATMGLLRFDAEFGSNAPLAALLRRIEAIASLRLEGRTVTATGVATAESAPPGEGDAVAAEALAIDRALAAQLARPDAVSPDAAASFHASVAHVRAGQRAAAGRRGIRGASATSASGGDATSPGDAARPERLAVARIAALVDRVEVPPLRLVAATHARLAAVAPFGTETGLAARALGQAVLRRRAVTRSVVVPLSAALCTFGDRYSRARAAAVDGDDAALVGVLAQAAVLATSMARALAADLDAARRGWHERLTARRDSHAWRLLDAVPAHPVLDAASAAALLGITANNVYPAMRALVDARILTPADARRGGRFRSDEVLGLVDGMLARCAPSRGAGSPSPPD